MSGSEQVDGAARIEVPKTAADVAALEARYRPFDPVEAWSGVAVDEARWQRHRDALRSAVADAEPAIWTDIQDRFLRAAALDSTALAELVRPAPDVTSVVLRSSLSEGDWSEVVDASRVVVECHRRALVVAADAAAAGRPIDEHLIATLQDLIVESQESYMVTVHGGDKTEVILPRGQYKPISNYLVRVDHEIMLFAPASEVASEMQRLSGELASEAFARLHPVVQSVYLHLALIRIHPFADGNGRLARTLASMPLLREVGLPQLILSDQWPAYVQALAGSDDGDNSRMLDLFLAAQVNAMDLGRGLLEAGAVSALMAPSNIPAESGERALLDLAEVHLRDVIGTARADLRIAVTRSGAAADALRVAIATTDGAGVLDVELSVQLGDAPRWLNLTASTGEILEVWRDDAYPAPVEIVHLRVRAWLDRLVHRGVDASPPVAHVRGLFVLGVPRSGTTLLGNYLGSHPDVLGLAEYGGFYVANSIAPAYLGRLPGRQHDGFLAGLRALAVEQVAHAARQQGKPWFCDATPWNLQVAASIAQALPDAVFVLLLRHFSGAIVSMRQFHWTGRSWTSAAKLWVELNSCIPQLPQDRTLVIDYDALAQDPAATVTGIREALGALGLEPDHLDDRQFATSHAHVVGRPRPTIGSIVDDRVVFHPIASLDEDRWTPEVHAQVWPIVGDLHRALAERFPDLYVPPPRPPHVPPDQW